jgi:uncharacterized membrane protein YkvA (DUF1232 family)
MAIRTTRELKRYLEGQSLSPEAFARGTKISNMTIRRMLRHSPTWRIPEKYHLQLDHHERAVPETVSRKSEVVKLNDFSLTGDFKTLMKDLEKSGRTAIDVDELSTDVKKKLSAGRMSSTFSSHVKFLLDTVSKQVSNTKSRALAAGALLYFINPFDLIPDALAGVGYLDDFAVLTLVCAHLARDSKASLFAARRKSRN